KGAGSRCIHRCLLRFRGCKGRGRVTFKSLSTVRTSAVLAPRIILSTPCPLYEVATWIAMIREIASKARVGIGGPGTATLYAKDASRHRAPEMRPTPGEGRSAETPSLISGSLKQFSPEARISLGSPRWN